VTAATAARPRNRRASPPACGGPRGVVLGDLEVVAADGLDGAVHPFAVDQLDPDRLAAARELVEGERQPVAAGGGRGVGWRVALPGGSVTA
jgi:hypothetical protein